MNLYFKKPPKNIIIILSVILISMILFLSTYYFYINNSLSKYTKIVKLEINNINSINKSTLTFTKGKTIDDKKILNKFPSLISSLKNSEENLKKQHIKHKYISQHNNLLKGLENNISIYREIYKICEEDEDGPYKNNLKSLNTYIDTCMNYYSLVSIKNLEITLPKECLTFTNTALSFGEKKARKELQSKVTLSQNKDFFNSLCYNLNIFNSLNKNFSWKINRLRKNNENYNSLIKTIRNEQTTLKNITSEISNTNIPNESEKLYDSFINLIASYNIYLQELKYALETENLIFSSTILNISSINSLYTKANKKQILFSKDYTNFKKEFAEFQNKNFN